MAFGCASLSQCRPSSWNSPWYNTQYAPSQYESDINSFISYGDNVNEHWERCSWGFSLMRLIELYGKDFSAAAIYEYYTALKVTVKKRDIIIHIGVQSVFVLPQESLRIL